MRHVRLTPALMALAAVPLLAAQTVPTEAALNDCFDRQSRMAEFLGIVAASNGTRNFSKAVGHADAQGRAPITADTPFHLASVQKVLTRIAIGQLVDRGLISLTAPVGTYIRDLPPEIAAVTVDQLVQHRSGVASLTMLTPEIVAAMAQAKTSRDLLPLATSKPLSFRPGERQEYSNGGYFLLGAVIEAVSGKEYGTFLKENVFAPLKMTSTSLSADARTAARMSRMVPGKPPLQTAQPLIGIPEMKGTAAGDGVSSATDLLKLGRALIGGRLLTTATKNRLFPRQAGPWRIGQSGGSMGANTDFAVFPETGWVVVTLSNYDPPAGELMAEVMRTMASTNLCQPIDPKDRPSRMRMMGPRREPERG